MRTDGIGARRRQDGAQPKHDERHDVWGGEEGTLCLSKTRLSVEASPSEVNGNGGSASHDSAIACHRVALCFCFSWHGVCPLCSLAPRFWVAPHPTTAERTQRSGVRAVVVRTRRSGVWKRLGGPGPARPDPAPKIARGMPSFVEECQASLQMFDLARLVRTPHVLHPLPVLSVMCPKGPSSTFVLLPPAGPNGSTHGREWSKTSRTWSWSHNV